MKINKKGFTLLEVAVVLAIIGILIVGFLQGSAVLLRKNKESGTKKKLAVLDKALMNYLLINGDLPCPAGLKLVEGDAGFGEEKDCTLDSINGITAYGSFIYGAIPTTTLNIADTMMKDEWNNKFSYIVHINYTSQGSGFKNTDPDANAMTVDFEGVTNILTEQAVYAIISHGENGIGAWSYVSGLQAETSGASTAEAKNIDKTGFDGTIFYSKYAEDFDDVVSYKTKNQLIIDLNWEEVGCYITKTIRDDLDTGTVCDDTDNTPAVSSPLRYYEEYEWDHGSLSTDCCVVKCYKYGRLGFFLKGAACEP